MSKRRILATLAALTSFAAIASATVPGEFRTPYIKIKDGLHVGMYCLVADGRTKTILKSLGAVAKYLPVVGAIGDQAISDAALSKGDMYCIWMHAARALKTNLQRDNNFHRDHLPDWIFAKQRVRYHTKWEVWLFADGKSAGTASGSCGEAGGKTHSRCWTKVIKGSEKTSGFAMCLEPQLPNNETASIVVLDGIVATGLEKVGTAAEKRSCADRRSQLQPKSDK